MTRRVLLSVAFSLLAAGAWADPATPPVTTTPLHHVFVWSIGKDPVDTSDVELDVLEALAKRDVAGESFAKIFPKGAPANPREIITRMRKTGSDSLLVLRRRSTIDWQSPKKEKALSSLESFLAHRSQLLKPKNQAERDAGTPIQVPNAYGNTEMEINKGEGIVFNLATEKMMWRDDTEVKSAKDLPQAQYYKLVADKVADELGAAGLIPPKK